MNTVTGALRGELIDDFSEFFAPASADMISGLLGSYQAEKAKIENFLSVYEANNMGGTIRYFCSRQNDVVPSFSLEVAMCALNAEYWSKALALTDVYDVMPQKRRDEWNNQMQAWKDPRYKKGEKPEMDLPDFIEDIVRPTLTNLLSSRSKFFAERVDGIFRSLSKSHVTNTPEGFGKRMILARAITHYDTVDYSTAGYIDDLRAVIAKFMGRDEPRYGDTSSVIAAARKHNGQWVGIDGNSLRIRVYNGVGTAHLEVHPEMAWRLNAVLASLYPAAIPESFRRKPVKAKKIKDFELFDRPLPFAVVRAIAGMKQAREYQPDAGWRENKFKYLPNTLEASTYDLDKAIKREIDNVMAAIGGVKTSRERAGTYYQFDYDPTSVIDEIVCSGCIPDHRSHQFYPTPDRLARTAVEMAAEGAQAGMHWLEPSAGTGGLADFVPEDACLQCYEISPLHCKVLEAKGYSRAGRRAVACLDFLKLASEYRGGGYDRVIMNPPFSEGRWKAHTEAAAKVVKRGGVIVAILPASAKSNFYLGEGWSTEWSRSYDNEFAGTSISVVIMKATRI